MRDVASEVPEIKIPLKAVGVDNLNYPMKLKQRDSEKALNLIAVFSISAGLPHLERGTHMSRFVEVLEEYSEEKSSLERMLHVAKIMAESLKSPRVGISASFKYPYKRISPASKKESYNTYICSFDVVYWNGTDNKSVKREKKILTVTIPIMIVCPCSTAICENGIGHNQKALVSVKLDCNNEFIWIEDIIDLVEATFQPVRALVKREDEKLMVENAFRHPAFVEDVVRRLYEQCTQFTKNEFNIRCSSFESIHDHTAFAEVDRNGDWF